MNDNELLPGAVSVSSSQLFFFLICSSACCFATGICIELQIQRVVLC